jgi:hypothetical protein
MLLKIVRGKLWGKQSCPEGSKRPEMPVLPDTADRPQDRAAQPLVRRSGLSAACWRGVRPTDQAGFLPPA